MAVTSDGLKLGLNGMQSTWADIAKSFGYVATNGVNSIDGDQSL